MKEITVLLLDQMFSSTAIGPMEVFRHAGSLWGTSDGREFIPAISRNDGVSEWESG